MLENPLLLRAETAGQMRRRLTAPDNIPCDYTYGDMHRDFFNAGHATTGWAGIVKVGAWSLRLFFFLCV